MRTMHKTIDVKYPADDETGYCANCSNCLGIDEVHDKVKCRVGNPHRDWRHNDNEPCCDWKGDEVNPRFFKTVVAQDLGDGSISSRINLLAGKDGRRWSIFCRIFNLAKGEFENTLYTRLNCKTKKDAERVLSRNRKDLVGIGWSWWMVGADHARKVARRNGYRLRILKRRKES